MKQRKRASRLGPSPTTATPEAAGSRRNGAVADPGQSLQLTAAHDGLDIVEGEGRQIGCPDAGLVNELADPRRSAFR